MKQISIAILLCLCTLASFAQGGQALDLKDIVSGKFRAENIYGVIPIPGDGEHYSQMNPEGTQIIKYSHRMAPNYLSQQKRHQSTAILIRLYIIYTV